MAPQSIAARAGHAQHRVMHSLTPGEIGLRVSSARAGGRHECAAHPPRACPMVHQRAAGALPRRGTQRVHEASHRSAFHRGGSKGTRRHRSPPLSVSLNRPASVDTETTTWRGKRGAEARTVYAHGCGLGGSERKGWMVRLMPAPHNPAHPSDGGLQREGVLAFTVSFH